MKFFRTQNLEGKPRHATYTSKMTAQYQEGDFLTTANQLNTIFKQEVKLMLNADFPVCLVTSGGLDSSYVTAVSEKYQKNLECFNIAYEGHWPGADGSSFAREVAKHCGVNYNQVLIKESEFPTYILRKVDHLSMAHAVEARIPFCQPRIQSFAASLSAQYKLDERQVKKIVYRAARSYLPQSIIDRPKHFFTLPIVEMLSRQHILFEILNDTLSSQAFRNRGFFNYDVIQNLIAEQLKKPNNHTANLLWSVMILERWLVRMEQLIQPSHTAITRIPLL